MDQVDNGVAEMSCFVDPVDGPDDRLFQKFTSQSIWHPMSMGTQPATIFNVDDVRRAPPQVIGPTMLDEPVTVESLLGIADALEESSFRLRAVARIIIQSGRSDFAFSISGTKSAANDACCSVLNLERSVLDTLQPGI